jgi:ferredoxin
LLDYVFSRDPYYQTRRRNIFLVGFSRGLPDDYKRYKVFSHNYEEDILEHLIFDIFIVKSVAGKFKLYTGSDQGQVFLDGLGLKSYIPIKFAGPISEKGQDKTMLKLKDKVAASFDKKVWAELNKICLACGRCSLICPTCFCFNLYDRVDPGQAGRERQWTTCFYNDFSKMAGSAKPLDTIKRKIYFWYVHKFVRLPHEFGLPGCVGCGRCVHVCPVGINIQEVLKKI